MPFILPKALTGGTGNTYLTSGSAETYDNLPDVSLASNEIWRVNNSSGISLINRKPSGFYKSDGISWIPWETDDIAQFRLDNLKAEEVAYTNQEPQFSYYSNVWLALKYWFDNFFRRSTTNISANSISQIYTQALSNFNSGKFFITITKNNQRYSLEIHITISNNQVFYSYSNYTGQEDLDIIIEPSINSTNLLISVNNQSSSSIIVKVTKILND